MVNVDGAMNTQGTSWVAMHRIATKTQLEHLIAGGVLQGDLDEAMASGIGNNFLPCGLGS